MTAAMPTEPTTDLDVVRPRLGVIAIIIEYHRQMDRPIDGLRSAPLRIKRLSRSSAEAYSTALDSPARKEATKFN